MVRSTVCDECPVCKECFTVCIAHMTLGLIHTHTEIHTLRISHLPLQYSDGCRGGLMFADISMDTWGERESYGRFCLKASYTCRHYRCNTETNLVVVGQKKSYNNERTTTKIAFIFSESDPIKHLLHSYTVQANHTNTGQ